MIAIYARQSIDKKDSISIETQIEFAKKEAMGENIQIYSDKGYSGKNTKRPAFEQMFQDIKSGLISKVIVYRLDRISRSIVDFADFIEELKKYNTEFVSATERFDTSSPMGKAMLYIVAVFAQLERETIAERVKDNYYARVKKGGLGGGPAPYGFKNIKTVIDNTKMSMYAPTPELANVKKIFEKYAEAPETSLADVQRYLIKQNIKTSTGKNWDNAKLSSILKSPAYVKADIRIYNYYKNCGCIISNTPEEFDGEHGCILVGKRNSNERKYTNVESHLLAIAPHNGVIDSDIFLYCQHKLKNNKQLKNTFKGKYSWLTGRIKCKKCGYAFTVRNSNCKEGIVKYFVCSGKYVQKVCTEKQTHRVENIEEFVKEEMLKKVQEIRANKPLNNTFNDTFNKKIEEIDAKINILLGSLEESSGASINYISNRINQLDAQRKELIEKQTNEYSKKMRFVLPDFDYDNLSFDDLKTLSSLLIKNVYMDSENIEIEWI